MYQPRTEGKDQQLYPYLLKETSEKENMNAGKKKDNTD